MLNDLHVALAAHVDVLVDDPLAAALERPADLAISSRSFDLPVLGEQRPLSLSSIGMSYVSSNLRATPAVAGLAIARNVSAETTAALIVALLAQRAC